MCVMVAGAVVGTERTETLGPYLDWSFSTRSAK